MKNSLLTFLLCFVLASLAGQSQMVQSWNYNSTTRDTLIEFPDGDHNQYEKILMHYSMRCKDGLVSTGTERNKGCGEWDYSCNTYIMDSTRVDSITAVSPDFIISEFSGDTFALTDNPTYNYYRSTQYEVSYNNIITQNIYPIVTGNSPNMLEFGKAGSSVQLNYILRADSLADAGVEMDDITGLSFNIKGGELTLKNLRVSMANTSDAEFASSNANYNWAQVYYFSTLMNTDNNLLRFYENFEWDGVSNIAVNISYDDASGTDLELTTADIGYNGALINDNSTDEYLEFGSVGHIHVEGDFENISNEITVAFWQYGSDVQPTNSTVFEGMDAEETRQVNIHLPWGNGQVYWDCGNDGSGADRINRVANVNDFKNSWNHWAFTKNAVTGEMHMYLNGELWHSGTQKYRPIDLVAMNIGAAIRNQNLFYYGKLDEFSMWNIAMDKNDIQNLMYNQIDDTHPDYNNLESYYSFDNFEIDGAKDHSPNQRDGSIVGQVRNRKWTADKNEVGAIAGSIVPELNLHQGIYFSWVVEHEVIDSLVNLQQKVDAYSIVDKDLHLDTSYFVYRAGDFPVFDEDGNVVDTVFVPTTDIITISDLNYYTYSPMAYEIMSFVTPYGIGLDFGLEGKTWVFDVTDFGPILKGKKRMYMTRGGQWQEQMDIRFEFVPGIPDRNVLDIQQIWPVQSIAYGALLDNRRQEPREFTYDPDVAAYVIKSAITGHGQQGEFIPRNHFMKIGGFTESWQVWTECADNPIFPQGGTWPFDRAGWCPGAPTDIKVIDATQYFQFLGDVTLDYGIQTASGSSNYIIDNKLIQYGPPNKMLDLGIDDVIYPNSRVEHGKFNPTCQKPRILLKNHGEERITSATIEYGVIGSSMHTFEWQGSLNFLDQIEVDLDFIHALSEASDDKMFYAGLVSVNGTTDSHTSNNEITTDIIPVPYYEGDVIINLRTNNFSQETSYRVYDDNGNIIHSRIGGSLAPNRNYIDTLKNLNGCYRILIEDSNDTGISFWYAIQFFGEGSGYVRIKEDGGSYKDIATDFGKFVDYNFSVGTITDVEDVRTEVNEISVYPNPSNGEIFIDGLDNWDQDINLQLIDNTGKQIVDQRITKDQLSYGFRMVNNLISGIYMINISDSSNQYSSKIMIVDKI